MTVTYLKVLLLSEKDWSKRGLEIAFLKNFDIFLRKEIEYQILRKLNFQKRKKKQPKHKNTSRWLLLINSFY